MSLREQVRVASFDVNHAQPMALISAIFFSRNLLSAVLPMFWINRELRHETVPIQKTAGQLAIFRDFVVYTSLQDKWGRPCRSFIPSTSGVQLEIKA